MPQSISNETNLQRLESLHRRYVTAYRDARASLHNLEDVVHGPHFDRERCAKELTETHRRLEGFSKILQKLEIELEGTYEVDPDENPLLALVGDIMEGVEAVMHGKHRQFSSMAGRAKRAGKEALLGKRWSEEKQAWQTIPDLLVKTQVYDIISELGVLLEETEVEITHDLLERGGDDPKVTPLREIFHLVTFRATEWPGVDARWACAACYLSMMEVAVNQASRDLEEKGYDTKVNQDLPFKSRLSSLVAELEDTDVTIARIERDLASSLYTIRSRVLHAGYIPNDDEFRYILRVAKSLIQKTEEARHLPPKHGG